MSAVREVGRYLVYDEGYQLACTECGFVTLVKPTKASARGALAAHKCRPAAK